MNKSLVTFNPFFIPHQQFAESVEPGMGRFHNPPTVLRRTAPFPLLSGNPGNVSVGPHRPLSWLSVVPLIRIQESLPSSGKGNDDGIEHCDKLADVMSIGPGNDQRQRDATTVHQKVALASFFSPGLSGLGRRLPAQGVL